MSNDDPTKDLDNHALRVQLMEMFRGFDVRLPRLRRTATIVRGAASIPSRSDLEGLEERFQDFD